jgi:hypothetical protein
MGPECFGLNACDPLIRRPTAISPYGGHSANRGALQEIPAQRVSHREATLADGQDCVRHRQSGG